MNPGLLKPFNSLPKEKISEIFNECFCNLLKDQYNSYIYGNLRSVISDGYRLNIDQFIQPLITRFESVAMELSYRFDVNHYRKLGEKLISTIIEIMKKPSSTIASFIELVEVCKYLLVVTIENETIKAMYKKLPGICIPKAGEVFQTRLISDAQRIWHAYLTEEAIEALLKFMKETQATGVDEVGCGSGFLGMQVEALGKSLTESFEYRGHDLTSAYDNDNFVNFKKIKALIHMYDDPYNFDYLKQAARDNRTLMYCYAPSEKLHRSEMAAHSLEVYLQACREYKIKPTLILISTDETTDGEKFRKCLAANCKMIGKSVDINTFMSNGDHCNIAFYVGKDDPVIE